MRPESATTSITRAITVAAGVFAPGHLGELTQIIPFEMVDAVLADTRTTQQRLRELPSRVGVYLLLAMGLFEHDSTTTVWRTLTAELGALPVPAPSEKALRDLRRRLGPAPLKALFHLLAGPLARRGTPGVRYRHWRTVAFDGCSSIKVPDHERNRAWLGKIKHRLGWAGYPMLRLLTLVETGTRGLLGATFGTPHTGETTHALRLVHLLGPDMLLLGDRGFDSNRFLHAVAATGAQLLVRVKSTRRFAVRTVLPDGSYLTRVRGLTLRVIDARISVTGADGSRVRGTYRLLTTLLDPHTDPAAALVRLYHERWEIESAYYALRHTLLDGRVLRSRDPAGITQELWAILALYQALRIVMLDAVESRPGTDPDRASFTTAVQAARVSLTTASGVLADTVGLVGQIGRAVLDDLLPPRRPRFSARKVKSPISRYHTRTETERPLTSTSITTVDVCICQPSTPRSAAPRPRSGPAAQSPPHHPTDNHPSDAPAAGRRAAVLAIMRRVPDQAWKARDMARRLGITGQQQLNSFCVQMSQWAHRGYLAKTAPATYMIT